MKKCAVCHEPVVSGVVVHSECMAQWISVKDRLPKRFETVLVVRKSKGQPLVTIGSMDINNYWSVPAGRVKSVTHWMPMPEPPEVECDL